MSGRKEIKISEIGELHNRSRLMLEAIAESGRPVFQVDGAITRVKTSVSGAKMEPLNQDGLRHEISQSACCLKTKSHSDGKTFLIEIDPPMDAVKDAIASTEIPLPPIIGIITHPTISANGKSINHAGYDPETCLFLDAPEKILMAAEDIPVAPTLTEIKEAVELINEVITDIPFAGEADRAGYFAMLLTMICRPIIGGHTPIFLIRASTQGTGKTLTVESAIKITTGRPATPTAWADTEEELKKTLHSLLLTGDEYIFIDNVNTRIKSGTLAALVTSGRLNSRVLGFSKMVNAPCNAVVVITANNPDLSREIARRCVPIELVTNLENPAERTGFKHPDLDRFIMENRPGLIRACLIMARAWFADEMDTSGVKVLGSFESWSRTIGGILKSCGVRGFLENTSEFFSTSDGDAENWSVFANAWNRKHGNFPVLVRDILPLARDYGLANDRQPEGSQKKSLGRALSRKRDMVFGGIKITKGSLCEGNLTWKAVKAE